MNIKQRVLLVRINTKVVVMNVLASGLSFTTISIGQAKIDAMKEIKRALAMYLLSANSVDKFRALHAWKRARHTKLRFTIAIGIRKDNDSW